MIDQIELMQIINFPMWFNAKCLIGENSFFSFRDNIIIIIYRFNF